jgi:hypothetical protein
LHLSAQFKQGFTYPGIIEPDRMASEPGQTFKTLLHVPQRHNGEIDMSRLPLSRRTEDVLLMSDMEAPVTAIFRNEGFILELDWDRAHLPHCMMWIHDRGLDDPPWNGLFRGLGLEPMASAFDSPWTFSAGDNPLNRQGYSTSVTMDDGQTQEFSLSIAVREA